MNLILKIAVAVAAAAVLAACATPALADRYAAAREACLQKFYVHSTEDHTWEGDEPYLKVNTVFWRAPDSMDNPSKAAVNETVHYGDVVQAWDADAWTDEDDFVGSDTITRDSRTLSFEGDGGWYSAEYRPGHC